MAGWADAGLRMAVPAGVVGWRDRGASGAAGCGAAWLLGGVRFFCGACRPAGCCGSIFPLPECVELSAGELYCRGRGLRGLAVERGGRLPRAEIIAVARFRSEWPVSGLRRVTAPLDCAGRPGSPDFTCRRWLGLRCYAVPLAFCGANPKQIVRIVISLL